MKVHLITENILKYLPPAIQGTKLKLLNTVQIASGSFLIIKLHPMMNCRRDGALRHMVKTQEATTTSHNRRNSYWMRGCG